MFLGDAGAASPYDSDSPLPVGYGAALWTQSQRQYREERNPQQPGLRMKGRAGRYWFLLEPEPHHTDCLRGKSDLMWDLLPLWASSCASLCLDEEVAGLLAKAELL